jgi:hypothetical protein
MERVMNDQTRMTTEQRSALSRLLRPDDRPPMTDDQRGAIERLLKIAMRDTGQSRRVADFLLAWYNAGENGGWDPTDLWAVDTVIADDMMTVLSLIHKGPIGKYPNDWGFRKEIDQVWNQWRKKREPDPHA